MSVYKDIMKSLNELIQYESGKGDMGVVEHRISVMDVPTFAPEQIRSIRTSANVTQAMLAACIGVSVEVIKAWESGHGKPDGAACRILGFMQEDSHFLEKSGILRR